MAANKFATMLHRNCHKIIVILVYAVLEWILILLLLLNSLFSYLIGKFAKFFGLKPSCTWCSRLDHFFDSQNIAKNLRFDHVCEAHGTEISKLSYCSNHKRLAECKNLCSHCSSSTPVDYGTVNEVSSTVAFFTYVGEGISENSEANRCSCCDEILSKKVYPPSLILKPSWDVLDYIHKQASLSQADLVKHKLEFEEKGREDDNDDQRALEEDDKLHNDGRKKREIVEEVLCDENHGNRCEKSDTFEVEDWNSSSHDGPLWSQGCNEDDESVYITDMLLQNAEDLDSDRFICIELLDTASVSSQKPWTNSLEDVEEGRDDEEEQSVEEAYDAANKRFEVQEGSDIDTIGRSPRLIEEHKKHDEDIEKFTTPSKENDADEAAGNEQPPKPESEQKDYEMVAEPDGCAQSVGEITMQHSSDAELFVQDSMNIRLSEDREMSNQVASTDGSVINEKEVGNETLAVEHLKITIKAQEKALTALFAELEEERNAAATAAKETMAMITKLQEEKAQVQMEALQYQRMMEEQAEYDQEALQLLNDLMIKREKEKKEIEKELEIYRNKVLDYEAREKATMIRRKGGLRSTTSTASSGHGESIDNTAIDLNCEDEYDDSGFVTQQEQNLDDSWEDLEGTGVECITNLTIPDVSLAEFDEERLSILEELKILEAKLFAMHDDEIQLSENANDDHERKTVDIMAKKLLPLFDATEKEFTDEEFDKEEMSIHSAGLIHQFSNGIELENSKILIQEELGHVYERLQALEADKDFLKHCIRSMTKGNKGLALLQEILQHLRDLKSVELSARNLAEIALSDVSMANEDQE